MRQGRTEARPRHSAGVCASGTKQKERQREGSEQREGEGRERALSRAGEG
jgi:hypothetical protein